MSKNHKIRLSKVCRKFEISGDDQTIGGEKNPAVFGALRIHNNSILQKSVLQRNSIRHSKCIQRTQLK